VWMDQGRYHAMIGKGNIGKAHVINDGAYVYIWTDGRPGPGDKYRISQIKGLMDYIEKADIRANRSVAIPTEYLDFVGASGVRCVQAKMPEGIFTPSRASFDNGQGVYDFGYDSKLDKYAKTP